MSKRLYAAYFTGIDGSSLGLFYIGDGIITGVDVGGMKYDGTFRETLDGTLEGVVQFIVPAGMKLVTGLVAGGEPQTLSAPIKLRREFGDGIAITRIDTPAGPVNARFEFLREIV